MQRTSARTNDVNLKYYVLNLNQPFRIAYRATMGRIVIGREVSCDIGHMTPPGQSQFAP